jgi:tetratricopeptide (TPR) repeat protein
MGTRAYWRWRVGLLLAFSALVLFVCPYGYRWWQERQQTSYFANCSRAQQARQWDELQSVAEKWSRWQPTSADAWLFRAEAAQRKGDFAGAAEYLSSIPESDPKALPAFVGLLTLQFGSLNRPLDGVETCERILTLAPLTTAAHRGLIEFYAITLQRQKLIQQIDFAIEKKREHPAAYVYLFLVDTMRLANAVESNSTWLKTYPDAELFLVAQALQRPEPIAGADLAVKDKHEAIAALFERFPNNIELLAYETDLAIRVGNIDEVIRLLKRAPAAADDDSRFWRAKGWLHLNRDEFPKAKQALQRALELHPLDWDARNWMADLTRRQGDLQEAARLQNIVRQARRLREKITAEDSAEEVSSEILADLEGYARRCGAAQVADALSRRLSQQ